MAKQWTDNPETVDSIASNLMNALAVFPRQIVRTDALLHTCGLTMSQLQILITVNRHEASVGELSARMGIAKPNITPLVDQLCAKELAIRVRSEADRRIVNVRITEAGRALLARTQAQIHEQIRGWSETLTRTDARTLQEALTFLNAFPEKLR